MKKISSIVAVIAFCMVSQAEETVLFQSKFDSADPVEGWLAVDQKKPDPAKYTSGEENGVKFLQTPPIYFGISHKLEKPVQINDNLKKITLKAVLLQPEEQRGRLLGIALSSRDSVARDAGQAFWKLRDSGFIAQGYGYSIQNANILAYQVEGKQTKAPRAVKPFNFLTARDTWVTWTLVYDHEKKILDFFNAENQEKPFASLYNVKLDGTEMRSVWICCWGTRYRSVRVTCEMK